jgi:hypothetical protein
LPKNLNGITASTLFMRGVMENDFFSYVHFLRTFGRRDS